MQSFINFFQSGQFSDVTLVVGEKEFKAHRLILAARSVVFAAMFYHENTKEMQEGKVIITDIDEDVFSELLRFMYTGKVSVLDFCAVELFVAADKVCNL